MPTRRMILKTGVASIVILGAGAATRPIWLTDLSTARAPWREAGQSHGDPRLDALAYAVLAPNPHNRQPWLVQLDGADGLTLFCDLDRLLPETDPPGRQIIIGLGAFLELLRQAGAELGYRVEIAPFPDGEPEGAPDARPVARVRFIEDQDIASDPLFASVMARRTARVKFDPARPVSAEVLTQLDSALRSGDGEFEWVNDDRNNAALKDICRRAWEVEANYAPTFQESVALMRIGQKAVNENPDGIALYGPMMESLRMAGIMTGEQLSVMGSQAHKESVKFYNDLIDASMAFGWLSMEANTRTDQLNAGAGWVRLNLKATEIGLAIHPLSQVLQEFPEMADLYDEFHDFVGRRDPSRVQGLFRFGYAPTPPQSPRWGMRSRIIEAA